MSEREYVILRLEQGAYVRQGFKEASSAKAAALRWARAHPEAGTLIVVPVSSWHQVTVSVDAPRVRVT